MYYYKYFSSASIYNHISSCCEIKQLWLSGHILVHRIMTFVYGINEWLHEVLLFSDILVACTRLYNPLCRSVRRLVGHVLLFFMILFFWPHCYCVNGLVTSDMAPAHLHATAVAVYPALFKIVILPDDDEYISCLRITMNHLNHFQMKVLPCSF